MTNLAAEQPSPCATPTALRALIESRRAVRRFTAEQVPDATIRDCLELAVLARNADAAEDSCSTALGLVREAFEPETTAHNLRLIRETRTARGEDAEWIGEIEEQLSGAHDRLVKTKANN